MATSEDVPFAQVAGSVVAKNHDDVAALELVGQVNGRGQRGAGRRTHEKPFLLS